MNPPRSSKDRSIFLKLGGSLITEKSQAQTVRPQVLRRLCREIAGALAEAPEIRLLLGHGSGSFGHVPAREHGTRRGVRTAVQWSGFARVWYQASRLNRLVVAALHREGLPAVAFPASAGALADDGAIERWDVEALQAGLRHGLLPVVYGDVAFDRTRGGTILSTEDLFVHLAPILRPARVLLAGREDGVWADYPDRTRLVEAVTAENIAQLVESLGDAAGPDVTGGMAGKVKRMLALAGQLPRTEIRIFSGEKAGSVQRVLVGTAAGTRVG